MFPLRLHPDPDKAFQRCTTCCEKKPMGAFTLDARTCISCQIEKDRCPYCRQFKKISHSMCTECAANPRLHKARYNRMTVKKNEVPEV
jgi:hypothetical protein